jgi:regulator of protease activity HflC (stomatin/prohibitin superfamily)
MENHEILQRLLEIEGKAATLVDDAQAEADRRVAEAEKQNRARYDEKYAKEVQALEEAFTRDIALAKENYRKQLEDYHNSLKAQPPDTRAFFLLAEKLLVSGESGND